MPCKEFAEFELYMPLLCYANAMYLMDKAYIDFEALFRINSAGAFFVTRTKSTLRYSIVEQSFDIDQTTGLRTDKTIELTVRSRNAFIRKSFVRLSFTTAKTTNYFCF